MSTTIRVSEATRDRILALARATDRPMTEVLTDAVDALERRVFFDAFNRRYEELRGDSSDWEEIEAERAGEGHSASDVSR